LLGRASTFIHGTTHALNAIITGRTARTALIVSEGHRDILLFREGGRTDPFDHQSPYPAPYVPRSLTFELRERVLASGAVMVPLDGMEVADLLGRIKEERVEAIAVCLLWSTIRPDHELEVGALIEKHLPGIPYTLSHAVNATLREFRRASSAAIDASLKPLMGRYLGSLTDRLGERGLRRQCDGPDELGRDGRGLGNLQRPDQGHQFRPIDGTRCGPLLCRP
jgi:N-methylhydantoinase A